ncbi:MAG: hypothetical protein MK188_14625 [Gammaproteobacteria bacterium]|nr:hypothetical protein [Gammaproteobacteria bacterium]
MSTTKWLVLAFVVLAINNILLVNWIKYDAANSLSTNQNLVGQKQAIPVTIQDLDTATNPKDLNLSNTGDVNIEPQKALDRPESTSTISDITATDKEFIQAFRSAAKTDELAEIALELQKRAQELYLEIEQRYATMSSAKLLAEYYGSDSQLEKQTALTKLIIMDFSDLESFELKALYETPHAEIWAREAIIKKLISIGDPDGIRWAKQTLVENQGLNVYLGGDMLSDIYRYDPDFVTEYINNIDLNHRNEISNLSGLFYQEQELAKEFVVRNFDEILQSNDPSVLQLSNQVAELDLNDDQQRDLIRKLGDNYREKRDFVLRLLSNVEDTDLLREGYQTLERDNDRIKFLRTIYKDHRALARELAGDSDNPKIRGFAK